MKYMEDRADVVWEDGVVILSIRLVDSKYERQIFVLVVTRRGRCPSLEMYQRSLVEGGGRRAIRKEGSRKEGRRKEGSRKEGRILCAIGRIVSF